MLRANAKFHFTSPRQLSLRTPVSENLQLPETNANSCSSDSLDKRVARKLLIELSYHNGTRTFTQQTWNELYLNESNQMVSKVPAMTDFLSYYKHVFTFEYLTGFQTVVVRANIDLKVCKQYLKTGASCENDKCAKLHCCDLYLKGSCSSGNLCRSSHNLKSRHNSVVLEHFLVDGLPINRLSVLLTTRSPLVCALSKHGIGDQQPDNQVETHTAQYQVEICVQHNSKNGCPNGDRCSQLHICTHYIRGDCRYGSKCNKGHDLKENQPKVVLKKFGYSVMKHGENYVLAQLQAKFTSLVVQKQRMRSASFADVRSSTPNVCRFYNHSNESSCSWGEKCRNLHLCLYFIQDRCKFPNCRRSHDLTSDHSQRVLRSLNLDVTALDTRRIKELLTASLQTSSDKEEETDITAQTVVEYQNKLANMKVTVAASDSANIKTPQVCRYFNVAEGCHNDKCAYLHVCRHFILGDCKFSDCKRSHNLQSDQPKAILLRYGFDVAVMKEQEILSELKNNAYLQRIQPQLMKSGSEIGSKSDRKMVSVGESTDQKTSAATSAVQKFDKEICLFHLMNRCKYSNNDCYNYHSKIGLPYQWQWRTPSDKCDKTASNQKWIDFCPAANTEIERHFCDATIDRSTVKEDTIGEVTVLFDQQNFVGKKKNGKVRRLGTESSAKSVRKNRYMTEWVWYWKTEQGMWQAFPDTTSSSTSDEILSSRDIELKYLSNPDAQIKYQSIDGETFIIYPDTRKQINLNDWRETDIRRRPQLYRPPEKTSSKDLTLKAAVDQAKIRFPEYWDLSAMQDDSVDYVLVPVPNAGSTTAEFQKIAARFNKTLPGVCVKSIERIQNRELWESFDAFRSRMNKKRAQPVEAKYLFHGTQQQYIEAICQQGFDWRVSGTSVGTAWGKGSYFARDASYSKSYTNCRTMFAVQVLVGDYALGNSTMVRPPPKDPFKPYQDLFDSVVNDVKNPSIFVTFERQQSYPEYLIKY